MVNKIKMIRRLLNVVLLQVYKNIDQESDMLHNHSNLLSRLSGTAYKNEISYIRLPLSPPRQKKNFIISRLDVKICRVNEKLTDHVQNAYAFISEFKVSLFGLFSFTINPLSSHNHSCNNQ